MPDGATMFVKGNITSLAVSDNQTSIDLTDPAVVTGLGSGIGRFNAIVTPEGNGMSNLVLTTDVNGNGDGVQTSMSDGEEGPFKEKEVEFSSDQVLINLHHRYGHLISKTTSNGTLVPSILCSVNPAIPVILL